uniref:Uncharacterized protein n=1 Tax=Anopheles coluzzii TaxID=1518534 RepID=A0A8W7P1G6_ANOCL
MRLRLQSLRSAGISSNQQAARSGGPKHSVPVPLPAASAVGSILRTSPISSASSPIGPSAPRLGLNAKYRSMRRADGGALFPERQHAVVHLRHGTVLKAERIVQGVGQRQRWMGVGGAREQFLQQHDCFQLPERIVTGSHGADPGTLFRPFELHQPVGRYQPPQLLHPTGRRQPGAGKRGQTEGEGDGAASHHLAALVLAAIDQAREGEATAGSGGQHQQRQPYRRPERCHRQHRPNHRPDGRNVAERVGHTLDPVPFDRQHRVGCTGLHGIAQAAILRHPQHAGGQRVRRNKLRKPVVLAVGQIDRDELELERRHAEHDLFQLLVQLPVGQQVRPPHVLHRLPARRARLQLAERERQQIGRVRWAFELVEFLSGRGIV